MPRSSLTAHTHVPLQPAGTRLGERLRQLRVAAGLTQTDLAGDRFSKEYVSQIERGKTRPTPDTIDWLAARLGVDAAFLATGVGTEIRNRVEARALSGEAWALQETGEIRQAIERLQLARELTEAPQFNDVDRADVLFRLGVCRYKLASVATATGLLD